MRFNFRERKERRYQMTDSSLISLMEVVQPVLEAQARHAMRMGTLQCIKCQSQFTNDAGARTSECQKSKSFSSSTLTFDL